MSVTYAYYFSVSWKTAQDSGAPWLLSQHQFGWPEHRPRAYTILVLKATCALDESLGGMQLIHKLMRAPTMPLFKLLCAPQDSLMFGLLWLWQLC